MTKKTVPKALIYIRGPLYPLTDPEGTHVSIPLIGQAWTRWKEHLDDWVQAGEPAEALPIRAAFFIAEMRGDPDGILHTRGEHFTITAQGGAELEQQAEAQPA